MDKYGNLMGHFVPDEYVYSGEITEKQFELYLQKDKRLALAKKFEKAGIHNMRSNLRYYNKKCNGVLEENIEFLNGCLQLVETETVIDNLMLIEARARQKYYQSFNVIIAEDMFRFDKRTKRPPENAINAMISFGNTLLYNLILQIIWRGNLDPRVGIVHATNKRSHSLNLDFADVFKPIIVDRVIFTLINCHQIKNEHFEKYENGVYLTKEGKKIFITAFENKLQQKLVQKGNVSCTYRQLLEREIKSYQKYVTDGEKYKPYKYY